MGCWRLHASSLAPPRESFVWGRFWAECASRYQLEIAMTPISVLGSRCSLRRACLSAFVCSGIEDVDLHHSVGPDTVKRVRLPPRCLGPGASDCRISQGGSRDPRQGAERCMTCRTTLRAMGGANSAGEGRRPYFATALALRPTSRESQRAFDRSPP